MKKVLFVFLAAAAIVAGAVGYFSIKYSDRIISSYYLGKASSAHEQQREARAAYFYEEAIRYNPENSAARIACASLLFEMGNNAQAEEELLSCIKLTPDNPDSYLKLCAMYVSQGKIYDAVQLLNNVESEYAKTKIGSARPKAPVLSPAPGRYTSLTEVCASFDKGSKCYFSVDEDTPSFRNVWQDNLNIKNGSNKIYAVSVSENGIVSDISYGEYKIDDYSVTVDFKDASIEQMARAALKRYAGNITVGDLKNIQVLSNKTENGQKIGSEISTFSDFQHFKSLRELSLSDMGNIPDLTSLSVLPSLNSLSLINCGITDGKLLPICALQTLEVLNLSDNRISDLSPLCSLDNLSCLSVKNNFIGDSTPLALASKLTYLDLSGNSLSSTGSLGTLAELKQLNLSNCGLYEVDFLKSLKNLSYLDISKNKIKSIEPVSNCAALKTLIAGNNYISSISGLSGLNSIAVLDIRNNSVLTLRPLSSVTSIQTINISNNRISDLSPLERCKELQTVSAAGNPIDDASLYAFGNVSVSLG